jgi:hypothetical protein
MYMRKLVKVLKVPSFQFPLGMFSDGNDDYAYVLPLCFALGLIDCGQLIKIKKNGKVVGEKRIVVYGTPSWGILRLRRLRILMVFCVSVWAFG